MDNGRSAGGSASLVFLVSLVAGGAAGIGIGATKASDGGRYYSNEWAIMVEQPLTGSDKTFNWLLFCVFAAAGLVAAAAVWAAITVANEVSAGTSKQLESLARLMPSSAVPAPPATATSQVGPSFGLKPSVALDPPHL